MSDTLRSGLIRLAFQNPELRSDLLPLLREAAAPKDWHKEHAKAEKEHAAAETAAKEAESNYRALSKKHAPLLSKRNEHKSAVQEAKEKRDKFEKSNISNNTKKKLRSTESQIADLEREGKPVSKGLRKLHTELKGVVNAAEADLKAYDDDVKKAESERDAFEEEHKDTFSEIESAEKAHNKASENKRSKARTLGRMKQKSDRQKRVESDPEKGAQRAQQTERAKKKEQRGRKQRGEEEPTGEAEGGSSEEEPTDGRPEFLKEQGDKKVRNPETGNDVKIKSLPSLGDKAKAMFTDLYHRWQGKKASVRGATMSRTLTASDRSSLIRLAYHNPELRPTLLPLIEKHAEDEIVQASVGRTARLMSRQEAILKKYMDASVAAGVRAATGWDELPNSVRAALRRVKDQETLWMDVDRWFNDNAPASRYRWASSKTAGGSGAANAAYLRQSPLKNKILQAVAKHYGVSVKDIEAELTDPDAEFVFEYIGNDRALAMAVYRDMKAKGLV